MKYLKKRRSTSDGVVGYSTRAFSDEDPLSGVANLFDVGLVFIAGLIVTIFSAYHLQDLFNEKSVMTILKKNDSGQMELITKQGKKIKAVRVTPNQAKGRGTRLGVAYRLEDGAVVYVPEEDEDKATN